MALDLLATKVGAFLQSYAVAVESTSGISTLQEDEEVSTGITSTHIVQDAPTCDSVMTSESMAPDLLASTVGEFLQSIYAKAPEASRSSVFDLSDVVQHW